MQVKQFLYNHRYKLYSGLIVLFMICCVGVVVISQSVKYSYAMMGCRMSPVVLRNTLQQYAEEHNSMYPDDLFDLYSNGDMHWSLLSCNLQSSSYLMNGSSARSKYDYIMQHSHLVYVGKGVKTKSMADRVVFYTRPHKHAWYGQEVVAIGMNDNSLKIHDFANGLAELKKYGINVKWYDDE